MTRKKPASWERASSKAPRRRRKRPLYDVPPPIRNAAAEKPVIGFSLKAWPAFTETGARVDQRDFVARLLERYERLTISVLKRRGVPSGRISDAFGELCVRVLKRFNNSPDQPIFATECWLCCIAARLAIKFREQLDAQTEWDPSTLPAREDEARLLAKDAVTAAMGILIELERTVVIQFMRGFSFEEIGHRLGIHPKQVYRTHRKALAKMRSYLEFDEDSTSTYLE